MDYTILGRTGLKVSVMGVGGGGPSRLGRSYRKTTEESVAMKTKEESVAIIRQALDSGINFIDTAEKYGTEEIVGNVIKGIDRSSLVLSTKKAVFEGITPEEVQKGLEESLKRLGTDYVDIYHLHGVVLKDYDYLVSEIVPAFLKMREQGKIRL